MKKQHIKWIFFYICIDQLTKFIINLSINLGDEIPLIGNFFYLTDAQNYGTAFQIVEGHTLTVIITTILSLILLISFYHHTSEGDRLCIFGILMMMGGLCANLLDRLFLHYVRDILGICIFDMHIILNLADIFLWAGLIIIAVTEFKQWRNKQQKQDGKE